MQEIYYLVHITTEDNLQSILENHEFKKSIHLSPSIQWLGDGVYFWDGMDKNSLKLGIKLVKNKQGNSHKRISRIDLFEEINEEYHLNLDDNDKAKNFRRFLLLYADEETKGKELLNMLELYKSKNRIGKKEKNTLGKMFGTCINEYIRALEENGERVDLVSYTFYSGKIKTALFSKEELYNKQFCFKNIILLNNFELKNTKIYNNIK